VVGREKKSKDRREWGLANTWKDTMKLQRRSSNYLDIIRMEREGVEKLGVEGLMSRVQELGMRAGEAKNLEKMSAEGGWRESRLRQEKNVPPLQNQNRKGSPPRISSIN
jgi:hypothetical protein